ncbi:MAG: tetratricopeptide repeat protein [Myxococcales bacterium]|nr:tetratricopeptide repeat protein [Myxococcales bacterium]
MSRTDLQPPPIARSVPYKPGGEPEKPRGIDELGRPLDLETLLPEQVSHHGEEQPPPSLFEATRSMWPLDLPLHSQVLTPRDDAESPTAWERLVSTLRAECKKIDDATLRAVTLGECGRILEQQLGREDAGQRLLAESGSAAVRELFERSTAAGDNVAAELHKLQQQANSPKLGAAARAAAWIEHGLICEQQTGDLTRAFDSYKSALTYVPSHPVGLGLAIDTALLLERGEEARKLINKSLKRTKSPRLRCALLTDLASLTEEDEARHALLEQAHAADAEDQTALRRLIREVRRRPDEDQPLTLAGLYRKLAAASDDPITVGTALLSALTVLDGVSEHEDESGALAEGIAHDLVSWISKQPDDASAYAPLSELIRYLERQRITSRPPEEQTVYIDALAKFAPLIEDPREQAVVREQLARLLWRHLNVDRATQEGGEAVGIREPPTLSEHQRVLYELLLENLRYCRRHLPEQRWVCETLASALMQKNDLDALVAHLEHWARTQSPGPGRAEVLSQLGAAHELRRNDLAAAAEAYELAVIEDPKSANALRALGRTYEKLGRWSQAVETLRRQADETEGADRLTALRRVATMAQHELLDIDLALETLEEVARADEADILALYQLAALCRTHARKDRLISTLEMMIERVEDDTARTAALVELGELLADHAARPEEARDAYERALELTPGYTPALRALGRLYRSSDDLEALLSLQEPDIDPISDPALLAMKAGRVCFEEIGDIERAIEYMRRAYELNPDLVPAREFLMQLYRADGQISAEYDLLRAQDPPESPALLADYHYRLGLIALALAEGKDKGGAGDVPAEKNFNRALQHFRAAVATQPSHGLARDQLRGLLARHNDTENLVRMLEDQLAHEGGKDKVAVLTELGRLHTTMPGGLEAARRAYERAIEVDPEDSLTRREYEVLLRQIDDRKTLPTQRLALARISEDTHYKATLLVESAETLLASGAGEDREFAANAILGALREDPGNPYAVRQLEGLLSDPNSPLTMTEAVGARAVRAQSDAERAIFYLESAELLEWSGARNEAQRAYRAALRAIPALAPADAGLERIASGQQREQTAKARVVSVHTLMAEARDAAVKAGSSKDPAEARAALSLLGQILTRDPHYRDAIGLTRALASQLEEPKPALTLLANVFGRVSDPSLRYELGVFLGENAARDEDAVAYFKIAAEARPEGRQALRGLVRCYQQLGDEENSADAMERLLALYDPGEPSAVDLRLSLATYLSRSEKTLKRALDHTRIILKARNDDPRALLLMADLLERINRREEAAMVLERLISRERGPERLHAFHMRRARLLADIKGRERDALSSVERAAEINPANRTTILLLTRLLERAGETERVSAYLDPIRTAITTNIARGGVATSDLRLLAEIAQRSTPALTEVSRLVIHAVEPKAGAEPKGMRVAATVGGLQRVLGTAAMRSALLSAAESPDLNDLLACVEAAMDRMHVEFEGFREQDMVPLPSAVDPGLLKPSLERWGGLLGLEEFTLAATTANNAAALLVENNAPRLLLGMNLWLRGDADAWRGLAAVAVARRALGGERIRALSPIDLDLMIASSFEAAKVFNAITADPDTSRLRELTGLLIKQLSRRQRKALSRICQGLAAAHFEPATTARATTMTDLHMALLVSGDVKACLSAACLLDGFAKGPLGKRISLSRFAQDLLIFILSDNYLLLREVTTAK